MVDFTCCLRVTIMCISCFLSNLLREIGKGGQLLFFTQSEKVFRTLAATNQVAKHVYFSVFSAQRSSTAPIAVGIDITLLHCQWCRCFLL